MHSAVSGLAEASAPAVRPSAPSAPRAGIAAVASALPRTVVPNAEIAARLGVDEEWIASRTGISERRHAAADATLVALAAEAAEAAIDSAGVRPSDLDLVLLATTTADDRLPNAAPLVAARIGAERAGTMDVGAACTGFLSAVQLAAATIESGRARRALVIGADLMSRILDLDDRRTAGLFGDGAGAALLGDGPGRIGPIALHADAAGAEHIGAPFEGKLWMDGRPTFRAAVASLSEVTLEVAAAAGLALGEIDLFVYHQANSRILAAVGERLGLDPARVVDSLALHGNTSAASLPIALDVARADGRLRAGSRVLVGAFGAGFTWGAGTIEWGGAR